MAGAGPEQRPTSHSMAEFAGAGLQFAGAIVLFLFVGRWLDARLGTEPWLLLVGVLFGAGAGIYSMYRQMVIGPRERQARKGERE